MESKKVTVEEVRAFIEDAKGGAREEWLQLADASWAEIKKLHKNGRPYSLKARKRARFPLWNSIFKIRQPLCLSRVGIPVGKDTTQDGNDGVGATAAILIERLAKSFSRESDFFDVLCACRDDFLATDFATARVYYECKKVTQEVKERLTPQRLPSGEMVLVDSMGQIVNAQTVLQDDEGYFLETEETIDIDEESVCLEPVLYREILIDPDIRRWKRCKRVAFEERFSRTQFARIFGRTALESLTRAEFEKFGASEASPKDQNILVWQYWDEYSKETKWLPENGEEFIEPRDYSIPVEHEEEEGYETNGLYDLEQFLPVVAPLVINAPTESFWPNPEYYQLVDLLEDIHSIFSRMFRLTKAIVSRLLYDKSIDGLREALAEAADGDQFGVPNLAAALTAAGGSLNNVVQYIDIKPLVESLAELDQRLEANLNKVYKLTGTSDLLQGFVTDQTDRTFGERQMQEKYSLNQVAERQRKMAEFVCNCFRLCCEVAIKNFKDESLAIRIMPQTLPEEHKPRYQAALQMLKENPKRFRVELETDSTIALDEDYQKAASIELVNALTTAVEKTANIAQQAPELAYLELHALKFLLQQHRQGKLFQGEVVQAIDNIMQKMQIAAQNKKEPFDKDASDAALKAQELNDKAVLKQMEIQSTERIEFQRLNQQAQLENFRAERDQALANMKAQVDGFKAQMDQSTKMETLRLGYAELNANVEKAREDIGFKMRELMLEAQKASDQNSVDVFRAQIEAAVASYEKQFQEQEMRLEEFKSVLDLRERYMTEARLQHEAQMNEAETRINAIERLATAMKPTEAPVTLKIEAPKPAKGTVIRDRHGNLMRIESGSRVTHIKRDEKGDILGWEHQDQETEATQAEV